MFGLHMGSLMSGSRVGPRVGMGTARNPETGSGAGWIEFPEDGEHWTTVWTGEARLQDNFRHLPQHSSPTGSMKMPLTSSQPLFVDSLAHDAPISM